MPSLRKRVTSYIRQLSFHNEPREKRQNINENSFVTKYLQGQIRLKEGPPVISGKIPTDLPNYNVTTYSTGPESITGCYTGPNGGLTTVKRTEKHLSITDPDIDFIDTQQDENRKCCNNCNHYKILNRNPNPTDSILVIRDIKIKTETKKLPSPIDNTTMIIKVAGQEYFVTNRKKQIKSQSVGSLSDLNNTNSTISNAQDLSSDQQSDINDDRISCRNNEDLRRDSISKNKKLNCDNRERKSSNRRNLKGCDTKHIHANRNISEDVRKRSGSNRSNSSIKTFQNKNTSDTSNEKKQAESSKPHNYALSKSKSEGNPFQHRKQGKIIKISQRPVSTVSALSGLSEQDTAHINDALLPEEWQKHSDYVYGLSDSLYDKNQITNIKNGDPIADCFGVITRKDSAILAVADGVNWGEKACIAAKSAIHGCLHYLNKTIFNDTKPFENLIKTDSKDIKFETPLHEAHIVNTQEVFVCLLRAFNCAHDLILENNGMLTTLTVAVVLPLKHNNIRRSSGDNPRFNEGSDYVCCVCNVGDTLAYVYSQKYGIRSHDIQSNRDMRDALGALGPVDGTNPELSNLTLSITKIQKGDIVLVASDGLTDNFDPNVCKFTVNSSVADQLKNKRESTGGVRMKEHGPKSATALPVKKEELVKKPPIKPPRRNYVKGKENTGRPSIDSTTSEFKEENKNLSRDVVDAKLKGVSANSQVKVEMVNNLEFASNLTQLNNNINKKDVLNNSGSDRDPPAVDNPLIAQFLRENSLDADTSLDKCKTSIPAEPKPIKTFTSQVSTLSNFPPQRTLAEAATTKPDSQRYHFLRSKTSLDLRVKPIQRNADGIPYVTPIQRYELTLLLMEDILKHGISGRESECVTAKKLCENLMRFTFSITAAKRRTLEDSDMYYDNQNGLLVEVSSHEKKVRRKKGLEKVQNLPGKLDHVSVVAFNVGNYSVHP
ncbi:tipa [Holotrichia oblita]|uniref:Tipa n=1 Tax=Holotrichia oblita TaxID=644536 RepID=A0ACB9SI11_HOLOL|nr:tipa [Holotrichia oblita]